MKRRRRRRRRPHRFTSETGRKAAKARWEKTTKEERSNVGYWLAGWRWRWKGPRKPGFEVE